jgi:hypothetical protein
MKKNKFILLFLILFFTAFILFSKDAKATYCSEQGGKCVSITADSKCSDGTYGSQGYGCPDGDMCCSGSASGSSSSGGATSTNFYNPIGVTTVSEFLNKFLSSLRGIVAVVAIIFIVLGGILYMLSAGSEKMITRAKLCWTGAVIGLAIVLAAPSFLTEIIKILGGSSGVETAGLTGPDFYTIGVRVLDLLLSIFGIIAIISLVSGGGMYLTAYGDEKRIDTAKKIITYSIIGIVVALSALVIINQVASLITGGSSGSSIPGTWI